MERSCNNLLFAIIFLVFQKSGQCGVGDACSSDSRPFDDDGNKNLQKKKRKLSFNPIYRGLSTFKRNDSKC